MANTCPALSLVNDLSGELKEVLAGHSSGEMPISALWPKNRQLLPKIRYVMDELVRVLNIVQK
ncbi:LysR family transcriptional regulator [Yersinia enterocolitica]|uniref:Transcriptional regulator, LysR family n=1 Tax=Yersinia enterocolitica subsp. palearctica serotype O:3 (strain DSM 13030 / CIP 106945 / Y11) TaxID=930944 RepID=A0A0H3NM80_YERE1|nr:hypothetical protein [Yersinia enterocolitica]CCO69552.1 Transcriptional regulator, LysR family [Yersinia enterocolitica IP 10393]EHB22118.1 LysR family transcription regulatory protein [Yersinia enterocolitica subsp. palearctica PhRBD_Ye1]EKN3314682.1 LysR family transcriptional regulator [Yersinia enterocolitica]EKN3317125.1 LysR family transcriptional regulator [Yersinia enterocolitica]EKN3322454.1 LysR family transcriptional regulator [Yersinia enterocolitica]